MATLVYDCLFCNTKKSTFDIKAFSLVGLGTYYECYGTCRECENGTIFNITYPSNSLLKEIDKCSPTEIEKSNFHLVERSNFYFSNFFAEISTQKLADIISQKSPEHVPANVEKAFNEAATCFAVQCYNAAGAIFRLCLDLTTKDLMPIGDKPIKILHQRLEYLFGQNIIPNRLKDLSSCIKDDGNDAAHDGNIDRDTAEDMLIFTTNLLEEIYTSNYKIQNATQRRSERKNQAT